MMILIIIYFISGIFFYKKKQNMMVQIQMEGPFCVTKLLLFFNNEAYSYW